MWGQTGDTFQDMLQVVILVVAVICVPLMLFPKPIIEITSMKKQRKQHPLSEPLMEDELEVEN